MQNLTLQMAQTTTLKKALSATNNNNNTSAENAAAPESNTSFQDLLNKQSKAQKDSAQQELAQQKLVQQKPAPKISNAQEGDEGEQKSKLAVDYAEFVVAANDIKNNDRNASENIGYAETFSTVTTMQAAGNPKTQMPTEDADGKEALNNTTDVGVVATAVSILVPVVLTSVTHPGMASASENSGLPAANSASQAITSAESAAPKNKASAAAQNEAQDTLLATNPKAVPEQTRWTDVMQSATKQIASDESVTAKSMLDIAKEGNKDMAIKNMAIPASPHTLTQMNASLPVQAASTNTTNVYPGKAGWDQAISQKVVWMVGAGEQSATLTLNPPDLGPLQVVINVQNDKADTTFISDNAEVRQALQDGIANLREKMSESGIQLGQANVSSGGQAQQQFQQAMQNKAASSLSDNSVTASQTEKTTVTNTLTRVSNGLVDTFA